eukprot:CAMPEP_0178914316 /NCGR_PEP_ID=MMETSP0786-20121207/11357_1 /TAXON_ID=186022 /ORGANISM="Thalassionema frauenfeldii, Strain CCMP 1798" /LENGTH=130 /DNA_ID=CAMNT_0020587209 /DNA_START=242 /DNA_END=634 /DNA_ORIENTATION=-
MATTIRTTRYSLSRQQLEEEEERQQQQEEEEGDEVFLVDTGREAEMLSDNLWEEIDESQPSKWVVLKQILGIGGFTYVLAFLIVVMLSLNFVLGPGWLGQAVGLPGTGTFTEVSDSLPQTIDLSADEYLY